jgi:hypothetical protein
MTVKGTEIESQIRDVLARETSAILLSNRLFAPGGLFLQLASTEEERRALSLTSLFREALNRIADLRQVEFAQFAKSIEEFQRANPGRGRGFKLEHADAV